MPAFLFPLENVEAYFRSQGFPLVALSNGVQWSHYDGVTTLQIAEVNERTHDGLLVSEIVTVRHSSALLSDLAPALAAHLNRWAMLSALFTKSSDAEGQLICKVGIFSTDRRTAELLYAPLLCMEAATMGWHSARLVRAPIVGDPEKNSPMSGTDARPPFDRADLDAAKAFTDRLGYLGSLAEGHFTVEFPWDPGARSHSYNSDELRQQLVESSNYSEEDVSTMGGRTSLFSLTTDWCHPLYGNGVLCKLELPLPINDIETPKLVDELNRWELSGADLPPLFGAWCTGDRAPTFVSFFPNQMCRAGLLLNLTVWANVRQSRVRDWLNASGSRH